MRVGEKVVRVPLTISDFDPKTMKRIIRPLRGRVTYIHPRGRYHVVEFNTPGGPVRECFLGVE